MISVGVVVGVQVPRRQDGFAPRVVSAEDVKYENYALASFELAAEELLAPVLEIADWWRFEAAKKLCVQPVNIGRFRWINNFPWGPISFTLYASTTEEVTSDLSFFVKMGEMVPEDVPLNPVTGEPEIKPEATDLNTPREVQLWSWGSLKAKYRDVDESKSRPGIPWHPFQNPQELVPGTIYEFQIELQPVFKTFKKGCRLWLKIASDDALYATWDSSSRYVETPLSPPKNEVSIYHDAKYPSHLLLPVIPDAPEIMPVKPPLSEAVPGAPRFVE